MQRRVAKCHPFCMERKVMNQITYGLVRGSTNKQDVSHQIQKIKEYYPNVKDFFIEDGVSGTLPRELRPTFQQAIATCKKEKARLVCTHLDRLGRNASDILNFYEEEIQKGKIIEITKQIIFLKNIEFTLFLESIMTFYEIQKCFIGRKYKIKNL